MTTLAFASSGFEVVSVKDSTGKQVGLYEEIFPGLDSFEELEIDGMISTQVTVLDADVVLD